MPDKATFNVLVFLIRYNASCSTELTLGQETNLLLEHVKGTVSICQHCCTKENSLGNFGWEHLHCIGYTDTTKIMSDQNYLHNVGGIRLLYFWSDKNMLKKKIKQSRDLHISLNMPVQKSLENFI